MYESDLTDAKLGADYKQIAAELEKARQEAAEIRDKYLRLLADQENYRKRISQVYEDRLQEYRKRHLLNLLEVADNLERALSYADPDDPLAKGVRMTYDHLQHILTNEGVQSMETVGRPFDPALHEAVEMVQGEGVNNAIESEVLKGYLYQGKLLRPARVRVRKSAS